MPTPSPDVAATAESPPDSRRELDRWLTVFVWVVAYVFVCGLILADPDLWGHTLYGLRAWNQGVLAEATDPFSYTAPQAKWVNHEWLTEMQLAWVYTAWGNPGLWIWRNLWVLVAFLCAAAELRRQHANLAACTLLLLYGAECISQFVVFARPQVPTLALFTLFLLILKRHADGVSRREIWFLPPLMALWVNLHGGFLAGVGTAGVYTLLDIGCRLRRGWNWSRDSLNLPLVGLLILLATLVNPYGYQLYLMLWEHLATEQFVVEWQPLWAARQAPTYYVPLVLLGLSLPFSRRWNLGDALILLVIGSQAISHIRHVSLLAAACLILLPGPLSDSLPRLFQHFTSVLAQPGRWLLRSAAVCGAASILIGLQIRGTVDLWRYGLAPWDVGVESRSPVPGMPIRAVKVLKRLELSGNLLTDYGWAQFMFWQAPQFKLAFDGRYRTVYSSQLEEEFLSFQRSGRVQPQQTPMLDKYPTEIVLLPVGAGAATYLPKRSDFFEIYRDDQAAIWIKHQPRFEELIRRIQRQALPPVDAPQWQAFPGDTRP